MSRTASTSLRPLIQARQSNLQQCTLTRSTRLLISLSSGNTEPSDPLRSKPRTLPLPLSNSNSNITQHHRSFTTTSTRPSHRRMHLDDDRCSINTERSEYTNSGTDNEVASQRSAFDPKNIDPTTEQEASGAEVLEAGDIGNPLEVSPANREVSRTLDPMEGGAQRGMDRGPSQRFSPRKGTKVSMAGWTSGAAGKREKITTLPRDGGGGAGGGSGGPGSSSSG
ncbi:hypothetical protein FQN54_007178 [Arachnomyces sp. PD_36]|nr:hypothetical protein FQN54_007178 [Arachnomyces sp. PD_36]